MQLFKTQCLGQELRLDGSMAGWQALYWGSQLVSQLDASSDNEGQFHHQFELQTEQQVVKVELKVELTWQPFDLKYQILIDDQMLSEQNIEAQDIANREVSDREKTPTKFSLIGLGSIGLKLFKSAKVIKVLFAAGSLAAYSWLFSIEFAIALILCLVFH